MNLVTDKWIPVVRLDGQPCKVSLNEVFEQGDQIADLSVRPHERIALMRLLICIAQAALDGPADLEEWKTCGNRLPKAALDYLANAKRKVAFDLFGDGPRFLQARGQGNPGTAELIKLDFVDDETTTLFDNAVMPAAAQTEDWIALHLLTYQSYAAGGKVGGSAIATKGKKQGKLAPQEGKNAPCRDGHTFHTFVRSSNLMATIHANLVTRNQILHSSLVWGKPVWEDGHSNASDFAGDPDLPRSYLGRMAPLCRAIWLNKDRATALNQNGIEYHNFAEYAVRDPSTAVAVVGDERRLVGAAYGDSVKHPWRELHALLVKDISDDGIGGPLALQNLDTSAPFDIWVGALVTSKAKIEDSVESVFTSLPPTLLEPTVQRAYEKGVKQANRAERKLGKAVQIYRLAVETAEKDFNALRVRHAKMRKQERARLGSISSKAHSTYWTLLENKQKLLVDFALTSTPLAADSGPRSTTTWEKAVWDCARTAYDHACQQETPRQIRAYMMGLQELTLPEEREEDDK